MIADNERGSAGAQILKVVGLAQGGYYLITGLWAIVSQRTFQKITGPKQDVWLVKTAGVLFSVIGGTLVLAGLRKRPPVESQFLGSLTALGVAGAEIVYTSEERISPVYLADGVVEGIFFLSWLIGRVADRIERN